MIKEGQILDYYICRNNIKEALVKKGYKDIQVGQRIKIRAEDLPKGSKIKIIFICDYCGKEFIRANYSNDRSKWDGNLKDSCNKCSRSYRSKETSLMRYGVDNPMKVESIQLKCEEAKRNKNFDGSSTHSCSGFVNGIPVSKAQYNLQKLFPEFLLNYHYGKYYVDLFSHDICIEYDGRGHDLQVRLNKITKDDFDRKEEIKKQKLIESFRLLKIIDRKDELKDITKCYKIKEEIQNFINSDDIYKELIIS